MKIDPKLKKVIENMEPGSIVLDGFMGNDTRQLPDIIIHDEELCAKIGLDVDAAVERMKYLSEKGKLGLGEPITVDEKWLVQIREARGRIPSPFEDALFYKINTEVIHIADNRKINFSELSLYLIEKYHFFQGHGSNYRIEPLLLKKVLEL